MYIYTAAKSSYVNKIIHSFKNHEKILPPENIFTRDSKNKIAEGKANIIQNMKMHGITALSKNKAKMKSLESMGLSDLKHRVLIFDDSLDVWSKEDQRYVILSKRFVSSDESGKSEEENYFLPNSENAGKPFKFADGVILSCKYKSLFEVSFNKKEL